MEYFREIRALVGKRPIIAVAGGAIVLDANGRVLLQRRSDDGTWSIPGGFMDLGESLEETARREIFEETGLTAGKLALVTVDSGRGLFHEYPNGDQVYIVNAIYWTSDVSGELKADGIEGLEVRFFDLASIPANMNNASRRALNAYLEAHRSGSTA